MATNSQSAALFCDYADVSFIHAFAKACAEPRDYNTGMLISK